AGAAARGGAGAEEAGDAGARSVSVPFRGLLFQMFNFGAPDADLAVDYAFYQHAEGARQLFNRTPTEELTDADLPPMSPWETQAFVSQAVPLTPFPPGAYELEVNVRDRLTRATAKQSVRFSVE